MIGIVWPESQFWRDISHHLPGVTTKMPFPLTGTKMCLFFALTATE
jgi:hypothetical protein